VASAVEGAVEVRSPGDLMTLTAAAATGEHTQSVPAAAPVCLCVCYACRSV
jgi:hypothetical protein